MSLNKCSGNFFDLINFLYIKRHAPELSDNGHFLFGENLDYGKDHQFLDFIARDRLEINLNFFL